MLTSLEYMEQRKEPLDKMEKLLMEADKENRSLGAEDKEVYDQAYESAIDLRAMAEASAKLENERRVGLAEPDNGEAVPDDPSAIDLIPPGNDGKPGLTVEQRETAFKHWLCVGSSHVGSEERELCRAAGYDPDNKFIKLIPSKAQIRRGFPKTVQEAKERQAECRAQAAGTALVGQEFVADEALQAVNISLLAFGGMLSTSTVISPSTGGDMVIPTSDDTTNVGEIVDENVEVKEQDITTGSITLKPKLYSSKIVRASIFFIQDSAINAADFIGTALGARIGRKQNTDFTVGVGTTEPDGIVARAADSTVTAAAAAALTFSEVLQLKHSVNRAYRSLGADYMCSDTTLRIMKEMTTDANQNRPLWLPALTRGGPEIFDSDEVIVNDDVADGTSTKALIYGKLNEYWINAPLGIQIMRLTERFAEFHQVGFLAFARADGNLMNTAAVKFLTMG